MNYNYAVCPTCKQDIPEDRLQDTVLVCSGCGWSSDQRYKKTMSTLTRRYITTVATLSALMIGGFMHAVQWSGFSGEIIPIQIKEVFQMASADDLNRKAQICIAVQNSRCAEKSYKKRLKLTPKDKNAVADYAKILKKNKKISEAANVYKSYFEIDGFGSGKATELEANIAYDYAQVLSQLGRFSEAKKYFYFVLNSKPQTLQVSVMESFVDLLIKTDQLKEAKSLIIKTRKKGENTVYFMESKLKHIKRLLKPSAS